MLDVVDIEPERKDGDGLDVSRGGTVNIRGEAASRRRRRRRRFMEDMKLVGC